MARANLGLALRAFADYRWRFIDCHTSHDCIHNDKLQPFSTDLLLTAGEDAPYITLAGYLQVLF
jgi:hypothetical protein